MKLDFGPNNDTKAEKGLVLISEPFLNDPYFKRTVVLLCEHNEEGSFGFVLNNYIDVSIDEIVSDLDFVDTKVSVGGPVKNSNLYYIHTIGESVPGSIKITDHIYMGGDYDYLKEMIEAGDVKKGTLRFFVGYSGWSPSQLENEMGEKSWYVTKIKDEILMDTENAQLWQEALKNFGKKGKVVSNIPENPSLN